MRTFVTLTVGFLLTYSAVSIAQVEPVLKCPGTGSVMLDIDHLGGESVLRETIWIRRVTNPADLLTFCEVTLDYIEPVSDCSPPNDPPFGEGTTMTIVSVGNAKFDMALVNHVTGKSKHVTLEAHTSKLSKNRPAIGNKTGLPEINWLEGHDLNGDYAIYLLNKTDGPKKYLLKKYRVEYFDNKTCSKPEYKPGNNVVDKARATNMKSNELSEKARQAPVGQGNEPPPRQ